MINGNVLDCTFEPITHGSITLIAGQTVNVFPLDSLGNYNITLPGCSSGNLNMILIASNYDEQIQSQPVPVTIVPGINSIDTIETCGASMQQYIGFVLDGTWYATHPNFDTLFSSMNGSIYNVLAYSIPNLNQPYMQLGFENTNLGVSAITPLNNFRYSQYPAPYTWIGGTPSITITEYGAINEFISGTFSGRFTAANSPAEHTIDLEFRVRRRY